MKLILYVLFKTDYIMNKKVIEFILKVVVYALSTAATTLGLGNLI